MARAGQAKTKMVNGERVDINTGLPYVSQPISSVSLTASQPINVPPAPIPVAAAGLQGNIETQANQFDTNYTKQLEDEKKKQEENKTKSLDNLLTEFGDAKTETQLQDEAYKKNNVDQLNLELKDINDQMLRETEGLRKQVESIQTSAGTATSTERNRAVQEATRVSLRKQADLSIIQLARQGKYDSAKEVADRAVTMELEQERQKLDTYKFIYQENKDLFTTAEARLFETVQADREREFSNKEYRLRAEFEQKIKQNDPLYQLEYRLKSAQAQQEELTLNALKNPDQNSLDPETLKRIEGLTEGARTSLVDATDTIDQLQRIQELVQNNSTVDLANPTTEAGRLYQRLTQDVVDKMARQRTGAVVRDSEQKSFRTILGVGFGNQLLASPEELNSELQKFVDKHSNTTKLIDPTGKIRAYLGATSGVDAKTESYLENVTRELDDPLSSYLTQFQVPQ